MWSKMSSVFIECTTSLRNIVFIVVAFSISLKFQNMISILYIDLKKIEII